MTSRFHRACLWLAHLLVRWPRRVLALLAISVVVSLVLAIRLPFDFSPQAIYRSNDDLVSYAEGFKQAFGYDESIILILLEATGARDVLEVAALQWQADIAADIKAVPRVHSVASLATLEIPRATFGGMELRPVVPEIPVSAEAADDARMLLAALPLVRGGMLSEDDKVAAVPVFLEPGGRKIAEMRKTVAAVRAAVARRPLPEGYRVRFTGLPVLRVEVVENLRADLQRLMPLSGAVYFIVLGVMFRCASGVVAPLAAVGIGVLWTLATFAAIDESLNVVSNVLPVLLVIIGVSSSVQIVSCYAEECANGQTDRATAACEAIVRMAPACLLAAITTAVGFASLCTAHSVLLQRFGWQAAIGVGFQYAATLITLGTAFAFCPPPRHNDWSRNDPGRLARLLGAEGAAAARHSWLTIAGTGLVIVGAIWAGSRVKIDSYALLETFPPDHPSVQTMRLVEDKLSGIMPLEISLAADQDGRFLEPDVFHRVVEIEQLARQQPGVLAVESYADLFREVLVHWPGRRRSESDEQLVPSGHAGRVRLMRTERFVLGFSEAFHYDSYVTADGRRARIRLRLREIGSRRTLELIRTLESKLAAVFPPGGPITPRMTGEAYVNARALNTLIGDLYYSLLTASFVIFGLIAIEFRSLRIGMIAALPNLTPLAITLGYMGIRGYDLNVGNVIVFTICLGLADDNTIHILYRFREELQKDGDVTAAIRRAFFSTGRAIIATSIVLLAGMTVLLFSNFVPTRHFAELTGVTILGNLLGVLLLLPACLVLFWKTSPNSAKGHVPNERSSVLQD
jgi:predicted RND superfamily exporter protein